MPKRSMTSSFSLKLLMHFEVITNIAVSIKPKGLVDKLLVTDDVIHQNSNIGLEKININLFIVINSLLRVALI